MNMAVLLIVVLIIVVVAAMVLAMVWSNKKAQQERMMAVIRGKGAAGGAQDKNSARSAQDKRRDEIAKKLKEGEQGAKRKSDKPTIAMQLEQAGLSWKLKHYWIFSAISCAVLVALSLVLKWPSYVVLMMAIIGFMGIPKFFVSRKIKKRQKKFLEEFPDALDAMVRLLKAGMPVTEAIYMASQEFEGPVGQEMGRIYNEQKVGISLPEATLGAAKRIPITEMQMFATGIAIQTQTGSSLSEVLMNLSGVIRARFKLRRKVDALSSEAKASAMIIGALPFLVGGGIFGINPEYGGLMISTTVGKVLLAGSAVWMGMGILSMKIMINFKV